MVKNTRDVAPFHHRVLVAGDVETQQVAVSDRGLYAAENLVSDFACLKVNGEGRASVAVNHELSVMVIGRGQVRYRGSPEVSQRIIGTGSVSRISRRAQANLGRELPQR